MKEYVRRLRALSVWLFRQAGRELTRKRDARSYGGSAEQAIDSRRTHGVLNQGGIWRVRYEQALVIFLPYADDDAVPVPDGEHLPLARQSITPVSKIVRN